MKWEKTNLIYSKKMQFCIYFCNELVTKSIIAILGKEIFQTIY